MQMEKAENKPPPSQNPAAKRKREERARGAASKHNEAVHRTGKGVAESAPEANRAVRKVAAPTDEPATAEERARHVAEGEDARRGRT